MIQIRLATKFNKNEQQQGDKKNGEWTKVTWKNSIENIKRGRNRSFKTLLVMYYDDDDDDDDIHGFRIIN